MSTDDAPRRNSEGLPSHVRLAVFHPLVRDAVRAALASADACVIVLPGAALPETLDAPQVSKVARVAAVTLEAARDLARARAHAAAEQLGDAPPDGRGWCLVLDVGQRCAVLALPRGPQPSASIDAR